MPKLKQYQSTIACPVSLNGIGLHSGQNISMKLLPAEVDSGIVFKRVDLPNKPEMAAVFNHVNSTFMCTSLDGEFRLSTVEHFLAAVAGLSIDNILVEINGEELPILDGSSQNYIFILQAAGIIEQPKKRKYLKLTKEFTVENDGGYIKMLPYNGLRISYQLDYKHPEFSSNNQHVIDFKKSLFMFDIAAARTFGFVSDFCYLREKGLIKGGSMDNALVFDENKLLNPEGFRFNNECARHKVLDVVGDLMLLGLPLMADLSCFKSGHTLNHMLVKQIIQSKDHYEIVEL